MKLRKLTAAAAALSLLLSMTACVVTEEAESEAPETVTETEKATETETETETEPPLAVIGVEAEGENVFAVVLKNSTGKDIKGFSVKDPSLEEYPDSMLPDDEVFLDGEERILYYDADSAVKAAAEAAEGADPEQKAVNIDYRIQIIFDDDEEAELHGFPFGDAEEAEICASETDVFVKYTSTATGEEVSTEELEADIREQEEAASQQETYQQTSAPAPAPAETSAPAPAETSAPAPAETSAPAPAETQAPAPAETQAPAADPDEGCLTGDPDEGCLGGDQVVVY